MPDSRLVIVIGPTASGKSALALSLAERAGAEVISADSQQVYRGMDVGTGKVTRSERARVPHHLLDVLDPDEEMTAARFVSLADRAIQEIAGRGRKVVVAGGTGLYVRALLFGLHQAPGGDEALRAAMRTEVRARGIAYLWRRLEEVDPASAARIDQADEKRIIRALEVFELTGVPLSDHHRRHDHRRVAPRYPARLVGLAPPREALRDRIDERVDEMMDSGLLDEVRRLRDAGFGPALRSQQAIGYAELHEHLDGRSSLGQAVERIKRNSRRYARRQIAWYRRDPRVEWSSGPGEVDLHDLEGYLAGS